MTTKIMVMTDVHANLPALRAALHSMDRQGYDLLVHTGDAIAIGPHPAECLDLLLGIPNCLFVRGNHDAYFADGLPTPQPPWMSDGEVVHQQWTHAQLGEHHRQAVRKWPYLHSTTVDGVRISFLHYGLDGSGKDFLPILRQPEETSLDQVFGRYDSSLIFYGHHHPFSDIQGTARYINPGSLGCAPTAVARYSIVMCDRGGYTITHQAIPYEDGSLPESFVQRNVPEREFITKIFFGNRFSLD
jgi:predicted phosphodiesterase